MWARLKEEKKTVAVCRAVIRELNNGLVARDAELQIERQKRKRTPEKHLLH